MKKMQLTSLDDFIDEQYGKRGTPRRDEFEQGYKLFEQEALAELEREQKAKARKKNLSTAKTNRVNPR
jgi:hypothetical protein